MGLVTHIQAASKALLVAEPYFAPVKILEVDEKTINYEIQKVVQSLKIMVSIFVRDLRDVKQNAPGPYFGTIEVGFRTFENPLINRGAGGTGLIASDVAEAVAATLQNETPDGDFQVFQVKHIQLVSKEEDLLIWETAMLTSGGIGLTGRTPLSPVVYSDVAGTVTLSCATPGAAIFYTLDGSHPSPQFSNGTSRTPYLAPFVMASGQALRAMPWLRGYATPSETTYLKP